MNELNQSPELSLEDWKSLSELYLNLWKSAEAEVVRLESEQQNLKDSLQYMYSTSRADA